MDSEHRHELEENDLAQFLGHSKEWWGKHGNKILIVVLVLLLAVIGKQLYSRHLVESHERLWSGVSTAITPEALTGLLNESDDPAYQARVRLHAADLHLGLANRPIDNGPASDSTAQIRSEHLAAATELYTKVAEGGAQAPEFKLNARLGLAAVDEAKMDFVAAAAEYKKVQDEAGDLFPLIRDRAATRLAFLPRLGQPIRFGTEPAVPAPATQPVSLTPESARPPVVAPPKP